MAFQLFPDRPVLNFLPTLAERGTNDVEGLGAPADLVRWARESGLVDDVTVVTPDELERARSVREAAFRLVSGLIDGRDPAERDRQIVNGAAARPGPRLELGPAGEVRRTGGLDALLSLLAADCLDLFVSPDRRLLRWCSGERCTRPFVDRSRGGRRRWCGMKGCGDRAKAAAYRARRRERRTEAVT
ncbi:CGNR zinc finger domain-containing protein [Luteimicrobium sp. NPDC057192]|uniref:CGNR zinc finger domain-containing protein n=1 Tax=Luteimicrobium sp. NPDC057192 TaxID=3346042 RepID=UPI003634CF9B